MTAATRAVPRRLSTGQRAAVGAATVCGLALAAYGVAGSYETISHLALRKGVPLPHLVPAGIDGGLIGVILLDLTLTWTGQPIAWLRQLVRLLAAGTVAANAAAGWPDPVAVGLHTAAPLMLLAMVEAARTVLRRRIEGAADSLREPIPLARWLLAPWRTWLLWRRMVLWQTTSYREALETERRTRHATMILRTQYGPRWRHDAPADLVWMLRSGINADHACARILGHGGTDPTEQATPPVPLPSPADVATRAVSTQPDTSSGETADGSADVQRRRTRIRPETIAEARRIDAEHLAAFDRHASAATLRAALRIGSPEANHLVKIVRGHAPDPHHTDRAHRSVALVPSP